MVRYWKNYPIITKISYNYNTRLHFHFVLKYLKNYTIYCYIQKFIRLFYVSLSVEVPNQFCNDIMCNIKYFISHFHVIIKMIPFKRPVNKRTPSIRTRSILEVLTSRHSVLIFRIVRTELEISFRLNLYVIYTNWEGQIKCVEDFCATCRKPWHFVLLVFKLWLHFEIWFWGNFKIRSIREYENCFILEYCMWNEPTILIHFHQSLHTYLVIHGIFLMSFLRTSVIWPRYVRRGVLLLLLGLHSHSLYKFVSSF